MYILLSFLFSFLFGYILGSIPFGLLITRLAGKEDIRNIGSGNIGATNVLRTGRKDLAAMTLFCDALKGFLPVLICMQFSEFLAYCAALGAFIGHLHPVWLNFKGGKGIATYIGILLAFNIYATLFFALVWLTIAYLKKISSLSSLLATIAVPFYFYLISDIHLTLLFIFIGILAWWRHHENITRIFHGTESTIGSKG